MRCRKRYLDRVFACIMLSYYFYSHLFYQFTCVKSSSLPPYVIIPGSTYRCCRSFSNVISLDTNDSKMILPDGCQAV